MEWLGGGVEWSGVEWRGGGVEWGKINGYTVKSMAKCVCVNRDLPLDVELSVSVPIVTSGR